MVDGTQIHPAVLAPLTTGQKRKCVLILGMHRSGTSALTRVVNLLGAALPKTLLGPGPGNETGHWEPMRLIALHDAMLAEAGSSWDDWRKLDLDRQLPPERLTHYRSEIRRLIEEEFGAAPLFVLKEPRICRFVPLYLDVLARMDVTVRPLLAVRHPAAVAASLAVRNGFSLDTGQMLWVRHVLDAERDTRDLRRSTVEFDTLLSDWANVATAVGEALDIQWPHPIADAASEVEAFLLPGRSQHGTARASGTDNLALAAWVRRVYEAVGLTTSPSRNQFLDQVAAACDATAAASGSAFDPHSDATDSEQRHAELSEATAIRDREAIRTAAYHLALAEQQAARAEADALLSDLTAERAAFAKAHEMAVAEAAHWRGIASQESAAGLAVTEVLNGERRDFREARRSAARLIKKVRHTAIERKHSITRLEALLANLQTENEREAELNRQLELRVDEAWRAVEQTHTLYRSSTSWLLTAPLRALAQSPAAGIKILSKARSVSNFASNAFAAPNQASHRFINQLASTRSEVLSASWHRDYARLTRTTPAVSEIPTVTISAVLFNAERWLPRFFDTILAQEFPSEKLSLHFVDHRSTDNTVKLVEAFDTEAKGRFRSIQLSFASNNGYGAGNDTAIRASTDDFVLVTNVDVEFHPNSLARAAAFAARDETDVCCWEFRQCPLEHPKYYDPVTLETAWCSHSCILIRRDAYLKVGGYDKRIFMYGEDVELSYRLRALGFRLRYLPSCTVTHHVALNDTSVRPKQLSGSLAANVLLRYRYGAPTEGVAGDIALRALASIETDSFRSASIATACKIVNNNRRHFGRLKPTKRDTVFPFVGFDYHLARDGHDIPLTPAISARRPKVTVITRTHGQKLALLTQAIAAVCNQTYPNIEHLIVEDRTDFALPLVEQVARLAFLQH